MHDLNRIASLCGIVCTVGPTGFTHLATAWSVGPGEWVTAWPGDEPETPPTGLKLLLAQTGGVHDLTGWEYDGGMVGMQSVDIGGALPVHDEGAQLHKRDPLCAFGYPDMIDHPTVRLSRAGLTAERYFPYLCPWKVPGHLCLFTKDDGFLTGRFYNGMAGGPVLDAGGRVVGVLLGGDVSPDHPPLARFRRLA
jgi:hypothetical protein